MEIDWGFVLFVVLNIVSIIIALLIVKKYSKNPHKTLINLVTTNIILDFLAIAIWVMFPGVRWTVYNLDFVVVSLEAAVASGLFAVALFGLKKTKSWAPILAIVITVFQRVFSNYVFFLSIMNGVTLIWSLLIIYFAYLDIKQKH